MDCDTAKCHYNTVRYYMILMAQCKTAVSPLIRHWRYCGLALNHQYYIQYCSDYGRTQTGLWLIKDPQLFTISLSILGVLRRWPRGLSHQLRYPRPSQHGLPQQRARLQQSIHQGLLAQSWQGQQRGPGRRSFVNLLRPRQNGGHFADTISKFIFWIEDYIIWPH